jgi:hypothetical protein
MVLVLTAGVAGFLMMKRTGWRLTQTPYNKRLIRDHPHGVFERIVSFCSIFKGHRLADLFDRVLLSIVIGDAPDANRTDTREVY